MKILAVLATLSTLTAYADPGIMIDIDIVIQGPSGIDPPELACK